MSGEPIYPRCQVKAYAHGLIFGCIDPAKLPAMQCQRVLDHEGSHECYLPQEAGADAGKLFAWPSRTETTAERTLREVEETNAAVRELRALLDRYYADAFTKLGATRLNALLVLDLLLAQCRAELDTMIRNLTKTEIPLP